MDPNMMILAENMAKHYVSVLYRIKLKRKAYMPQWLAMKVQDRQDMIEAFGIILGKADEESLKEAMTLKNPLEKPHL